jgi:hypothetical protein
MLDEGLQKAAAPLGKVGRLTQGTWRLTAHAVWALALGAILGTGLYVSITEGMFAGLFVSAIMLTEVAFLTLVMRRLLPAVVLVTSSIAIIRAAAYVKQQTSEVLLHAHDVVSLASSWSAMARFWHDHRLYALSLFAAVAAAAAMAYFARRLDTLDIGRKPTAAAALLLLGVASLAATAKGDRRHTEYYFENVYVSYFLASWRETLEALWHGSLIQVAPTAAGRLLGATASCELRDRPPNIVLIHQESIVPPSYYPRLSYDRSLDGFFQSYDGQLRKLRVETFGGGSWLTEFSVLTGLSTYSFGGMRQVVQQVMAGKVRDTLPQALSRCG